MNYFKKCLKSKTVWTGVGLIVASLGLYFTGEQNLQELFLGQGGILMILLRLITDKPIEHK